MWEGHLMTMSARHLRRDPPALTGDGGSEGGGWALASRATSLEPQNTGGWNTKDSTGEDHEERSESTEGGFHSGHMTNFAEDKTRWTKLPAATFRTAVEAECSVNFLRLDVRFFQRTLGKEQ
jgi:hypothetical protein